jgi:hypothetical protein
VAQLSTLLALAAGLVAPSGAVGPYRTLMIDQGFCFNAGEWKFPDAPLGGLYARNRVYESITGMQSFGPWLERLEQRITERVLDDISRDIPSEWYEDDYDSLLRLMEQIFRRRTRVPELLLEAKKIEPSTVSELGVNHG